MNGLPRHLLSKVISAGTSQRTSNMLSTHSNKSNLRRDSCCDFPEDAELLTCITRGLSRRGQGKSTARLCNSGKGEVNDLRHQCWFAKGGLSTMSSDGRTGKPVISKPLSLPRACLSARIAENLGQPVLSRVELLSFVYFYILKDHTVPKTSGPILLTNKLQHTDTQLKQHQDLAKPEPHNPNNWMFTVNSQPKKITCPSHS